MGWTVKDMAAGPVATPEAYQRRFDAVLDRVNNYIESGHDLAVAKRHLHRALSRLDPRSEEAAYLNTALDSIEEVRK